MKEVIVKNSPINGKGIFANKKFKKGDIVLKWDLSHEISKKEAEELAKGGLDISYSDKKYIITQEPEKYVNHSCDPNTKVENFCDVAIKNIKKGEEITTDYSKDLAPGISTKCNCGSKNCRGFI